MENNIEQNFSPKSEPIRISQGGDAWSLAAIRYHHDPSELPILQSEIEKEIPKRKTENIQEYMKNYKQLNKEKLREKAREKHVCDYCGGKYTSSGKYLHLKTKKHQNSIN